MFGFWIIKRPFHDDLLFALIKMTDASTTNMPSSAVFNVAAHENIIQCFTAYKIMYCSEVLCACVNYVYYVVHVLLFNLHNVV
jgi:hypothetical protein